MRYLAFILAALTTTELQAFDLAPKLVVNVTIDQLRSDYMEAFNNFYSRYGFRRVIDGGLVYDGASYPFFPIDRSSSTATIATGTTPFYHGIIGNQWLERKTLQPTGCVEDEQHKASPSRLRTSTVGDELKVSTNGKALIYSFAVNKESAILSGGHAANGAFWLGDNGLWTSSSYYSKSLPKWIKDYNKEFERLQKKREMYQNNDNVVDVVLDALQHTELGQDEYTDMLNITLTATPPNGKAESDWQKDMSSVYHELDFSLGRIINSIEKRVGLNQVLFVITLTG